MKNYEIENHIRSAVRTVTPDIYDRVADMPVHKEVEDFTNIQSKGKRSAYKKIYGAAAAMAACLLFFFAGIYWAEGRIISIVDIDVNPSIEIQMNKKDKVVKVLALNEEGRQVLDGMNLEKVDINVASNAILGAIVKLGFINDLNNAILVTVQSDIAGKSEELKEKISFDINQVLDQNSLNGIVLNQDKKEDVDLDALAEKYNISYGKALFIYNMTMLDKSLTIEELAPMSIGELTALINGNTNIQLNDIAVDKSAYIGIEKAGEIALDSMPGSALKGVELEYGSNEVVYEVEILMDEVEYDLRIDAYTGEILSFEGEEPIYNDEYNYQGHHGARSEKGGDGMGYGGHHRGDTDTGEEIWDDTDYWEHDWDDSHDDYDEDDDDYGDEDDYEDEDDNEDDDYEDEDD